MVIVIRFVPDDDGNLKSDQIGSSTYRAREWQKCGNSVSSLWPKCDLCPLKCEKSCKKNVTTVWQQYDTVTIVWLVCNHPHELEHWSSQQCWLSTVYQFAPSCFFSLALRQWSGLRSFIFMSSFPFPNLCISYTMNCIHSAWKNQAITSVKIWKDNMHSPESLSHSFTPTCSLPYCYLTNNPSPSSPKTVLTFAHSLFNHISNLFVHTFWFFLQVEVQGTLGMCLKGEVNSIHSHILPWSLKKAISMYVCNTTAPLCGN